MVDYYLEENLDKTEVINSSSGKYKLEIKHYKRQGSWNYTRGLVYKDNEEIADIKRNYCSFFHAFVENHPNGHDYLLCGQNYQGQTVIELDTGDRVDYLPGTARKGHGFCCAAYYPSPNKKYLFIDGCYWACPYESRIVDFSEPMKLPYKMLNKFDDCVFFTEYDLYENKPHWTEDNKFNGVADFHKEAQAKIVVYDPSTNKMEILEDFKYED